MTKKKRQSSGSDTSGKRKKVNTTSDGNSAGVADVSHSQRSPSTSTRSYKLISILSPAKTLKASSSTEGLTTVEKLIPQDEWTTPPCVSTKQHQTIVKAMKQHAKDTTKLSKLLGISANLSQTAQSYWMSFGGDDDSSEFVKKTMWVLF